MKQVKIYITNNGSCESYGLPKTINVAKYSFKILKLFLLPTQGILTGHKIKRRQKSDKIFA